MKTIYTLVNGTLEPGAAAIVREFPLVLQVNGREIATLIASPHDLRFLVAGFLRLQGFVESVDDFHLLSVCEDFGMANVRIKGELPERLKPVLTSGCGTGVTFTMPHAAKQEGVAMAASPIEPAAVFALMDALAKRAENYRSHGGIHSAAVGEADGTLLLYAEDLGRHNTLDRIAGEALLKGIDLHGKLLVTSGRVSTEMAAKAALLGISVIASRTSPTDMAIKMCEEAGITLIGYLRGGKFNVYAEKERLAIAVPPVAGCSRSAHGDHVAAMPLSRIPGVTGVILAGGASSRMGSNKALLPYKGGRFIESIYRQLKEIFDEVLLVTNSPEQYAFLPCKKVPDVFPGMGALAGIHAGLYHSETPSIFAVACDMPYLNSSLIRYLAERADEGGVLIPESPLGLEPLHAFYGKGCLAAIEVTLLHGERRIVSFFDRTNVKKIRQDEIARFDSNFDSFRNINTPADYYRLREGEKGSSETPAAEFRELCRALN
jgi:FdhD protein